MNRRRDHEIVASAGQYVADRSPAHARYRRGPMAFELVDHRPWQLGVMLPDPDGRMPAGRSRV